MNFKICAIKDHCIQGKVECKWVHDAEELYINLHKKYPDCKIEVYEEVDVTSRFTRFIGGSK